MIPQRLAALRQKMQAYGIDLYMVTSADFHQSEYVGDHFKARIDILSIEETVAVVRVLEENWGGRIDFTDYLLLLKIGEEWKCVAKAYNQNSDTIQK